MMRDLNNALRDEAGFTLVELTATLVLGLLVMFAILTTLDNFSLSASRQTRVTDANNQVRNIMDRVVSDLRQAATVEVALPNDLVYTLPDSATQTRRERLCLDDSGQLWRASLKFAPPPAAPSASAVAVAAAGACPTPSSSPVHVTNLRSRNSVTNPIFRYDTATAASVRTVGMTFALDAGNAHTSDITTLRASAFRRSRGEIALPVSDDNIGIVCGSSGPVLTLSTTASLGTLAVSYATLNGDSLGTASSGTALTLPASAASITVVATVTSATGGVTELLKTLAC